MFSPTLFFSVPLKRTPILTVPPDCSQARKWCKPWDFLGGDMRLLQSKIWKSTNAGTPGQTLQASSARTCMHVCVCVCVKEGPFTEKKTPSYKQSMAQSDGGVPARVTHRWWRGNVWFWFWLCRMFCGGRSCQQTPPTSKWLVLDFLGGGKGRYFISESFSLESSVSNLHCDVSSGAFFLLDFWLFWKITSETPVSEQWAPLLA